MFLKEREECHEKLAKAGGIHPDLGVPNEDTRSGDGERVEISREL